MIAALEMALIAVQGHSRLPRNQLVIKDLDSVEAGFGMHLASDTEGTMDCRSYEEALQPMHDAQCDRIAAVAPLSELRYTQGLIDQLQETLEHMRKIGNAFLDADGA